MKTHVMSDLPKLKERPEDGHKGTFGKVAVVAGSTGMSGAAVLTAGGALRSGSGLVYVAVPDAIHTIVASQLICPLVYPMPDTENGRFSEQGIDDVLSFVEDRDAVATGPGLGTSASVQTLAAKLVQETESPLVLDADGLNNIQDDLALLRNRNAPCVVTPHPGEFSRLTDKSISRIQNNRSEVTEEFAGQHGVVTILKGSRTVVSDGNRTWINKTGNPGMASGGTGDVLTGMITSFLGRGYTPWNAARLGVYLHGLSGDLAAEERSRESLTATDLIDFLPRSFRTFRGTSNDGAE